MASVIKAKRSWFVMVCLRVRCLFFFLLFCSERNKYWKGKTGLGPTDKTGKLHVDRYSRGRWSSLLERKLRLLLHLLSPSPLPTHIQFRYILSAAYHAIAETYAHKCADMCTGPGPQGGWGIHGELQKILILLPLSSFPCFSFAFASPLPLRAFRFWLAAPHFSHLLAIWEPSVTKLTDLGSVFSKFSFPRCHLLPGSLLNLCFLKSTSDSLKSNNRLKDVFLSLTARLLIDNCAFAFGSRRSKFHHAFLLHVLTAPTFLSFHHVFSSFHCCTFSLPLVQSFRFLPLSIFTCFLTCLFCHYPALRFPPPS